MRVLLRLFYGCSYMFHLSGDGSLVRIKLKQNKRTVGATVRPPVATRERPKEQGELHSTAW